MKFAVTVVSPPDYIHAAAFSEVAETLHHALLALGHDSVLTTEGNLPGRRHIVLGANLLPIHPLPLAADAIVYNLEQVDPASVWFQPAVIELLRRHTVWDYSSDNAERLARLGVRVSHVLPIGYVDALTRIERAAEPAVDVLFFGSMNARRETLFNRMEAAGLLVATPFGVYGARRDTLIGHAKLLVNVHYYEAKVLEMVRISYLLANRCAVLTEPGIDAQENAALAGAVAFAEYDQMVEQACALVASASARARLSEQGFAWMRNRPATEPLRAALASLG